MGTLRRIATALLVAVSCVRAIRAADPTPPAAASTLSVPSTAEKGPTVDGFIQRWLILEPIPFNGLAESVVRAAVKTEFFPNQGSIVPRAGDTVTVQESPLKWHAVESRLYNVNLYHFAHALRRPTSNVLFWTVTVIQCADALAGVRLAVGSNAASVWWVNGEEVIGLYGDRQCVIDDGVSKRLTLKKGANVIRAAIFNGGGATDFCARFLGPDERPLKRFTVTLGAQAKLSQ